MWIVPLTRNESQIKRKGFLFGSRWGGSCLGVVDLLSGEDESGNGEICGMWEEYDSSFWEGEVKVFRFLAVSTSMSKSSPERTEDVPPDSEEKEYGGLVGAFTNDAKGQSV